MADLPQHEITVSWDNALDQPKVDPPTVDVDTKLGPTVLIWRLDPETVERINAIVLNEKGADPAGEFSTPQKGGKATPKTWVSVDFCTRDGDFHYSVLATKKDGAAPKLLDPMIRNQP